MIMIVIRIPLAAELRQERVADVGIRQRVRLINPHMPAGVPLALLHPIQAESVALVHVELPLAQVAPHVFQVAHVFVADEAQPGR